MKWKYAFVAGKSATLIIFDREISDWSLSGKLHSHQRAGAAGTLIMLLVWVYYSAVVLYFGAEIAKAYAYSNNEFDLKMPDPEPEELY